MKRMITLSIVFLYSTILLIGQVPHALVSEDMDGQLVWKMDTKADFIWLCDTLNLDADNDGTDDFADIATKWAGNYLLETDITFDADPSKEDWNNDGVIDDADTIGLAPIGYWSSYEACFSGSFDGGYHTIENVNKYHFAQNALFGDLRNATIQNVYMKNYNASAAWQNPVAGIACRDLKDGTYGSSSLPGSTIKRCWVEGTLTANLPFDVQNAMAGGIVGQMFQGEISECVSNVTIVSNKTRLGGIAADLRSTGEGVPYVFNCYSVGNISGPEDVGGIAGRVWKKSTGTELKIQNTYSASVITSTGTNVGAFVGDHSGTDVSGSRWDSDIMTDGFGVYEASALGQAKGIATALFSDQANFTGWDFENIWEIGDVNGVQRPRLKWQNLVGNQVSAKEITRHSLIQTYPNPVRSILTILNAPLNSDYRLINMIGQTVESGIVTSRRTVLNVEQVDKGFYILHIGNEARKIIIE